MADAPHWKTQPRIGGKWASTKNVAAAATAASSNAGTPESLSPMTTPSSLLSSLPSRPFDSPQHVPHAELHDEDMDSMPGSMPDAPLFGDTSSRAVSPRDFLVYPKAESEPDSDFESARDVKTELPDVKPPRIDLTNLGIPGPPSTPLRPASPNRLRLNRVPSMNSLTKPKSVVSFSSTVALPAPALSTSFALKPPSAPKLSAPQPPTKKKKKAPMSNSPMLRFHGDGTDGEDAQDFLRYFRREMRIGDVTDDHEKIKHMEDYIASGSRANRWYKANTITSPVSWQAFETAFTDEWPEIEESKRTPQEIQRELLAMRIRESELGEKTNVSGKALWTHVAWAEKVLALAKEGGMAASDTYIWPVREKLPDMLKDKIPSTCADWTAFTTAVKSVDIDYLRDKVAKFRRENARIEDLNRRMAALEVRRPAAVSGRSAPVGGGNAANPGNSYSRPAATPTAARPPFTPRPPVTPEQRAALQTRLAGMIHHPNTDTGRQAYRAQVDQWFQTHGSSTRVSENTPFPLRPGSEPIDSGECYKCGKKGHTRFECVAPREVLLHPKEIAWRQICGAILRGGSRPADAGVNFVAEVVGEEGLWSQSGIEELSEDQGKELGSST